MNPYFAAELGAARARDLQAEAARHRLIACATGCRPGVARRAARQLVSSATALVTHRPTVRAMPCGCHAC
jgi:hypothetical protein